MYRSGRLIGIAFSFLLLLLLLLGPLPASAQYIYLDANGDGIHGENEALDPSGTTRVDIWLDTSRNRDGSPAICDTDPATPMTINSWEVVLRAIGGTVEWGPLDNMLPISPVRACFASDADTTDPTWYHNGWGGMYLLDPGLYHVGRFRIRVLTGDPAIVFRPNNPVQTSDLTAFGTRCLCLEEDNTYRLGVDWFDAAGLGEALVADAGGPYLARIDIPLVFDSSETLNAQGGALVYEWDFGDGTEGSGASPSHTYTERGDYRVTLRVRNGAASHETWTTVSVLPSLPPTADTGGPYSGIVGVPVLFDGRGSSDPNGDPLRFVWRFGDGTGAGDSYVFHTYSQPGTYTVSLTVYDDVGSTSDAASTQARIAAGPAQPPVADAGGPYHGYAGLRIQFDGTGSGDPDGDPLLFRWIFGDGNEGAVRSPHHAYADPGTYEIILEVSDGTFTTSDVTEATIDVPQGAPPTAAAGGPYAGMARRPIVFQGGGSTDPDGDALTYRWDFGDRTIGEGPSPSHVYYEAAQYGVILTVSDGTFAAEARTTALVTQAAPAKGRAFLTGGKRDLALSALGSTVTVRLEPLEGSFTSDEIDRERISLRSEAAIARSITAAGADPNAGDSDGNGVDEIAVVFRAEDIRELLSYVAQSSSVRLTLEAPLRTGEDAVADWTPRVMPASAAFEVIIRPNPFNPQAIVSFVTTRPGNVSAQLYDTAGRLVRTVIRDQAMDAGPHDLPVVARSDSGAGLSSGVYFLKLVGPDGVLVKRVTVAK